MKKNKGRIKKSINTLMMCALLIMMALAPMTTIQASDDKPSDKLTYDFNFYEPTLEKTVLHNIVEGYNRSWRELSDIGQFDPLDNNIRSNRLKSSSVNIYDDLISYNSLEDQEELNYYREFTKINIPGSFSIGKKTGEPAFPVFPVKILLPQGTEIVNINVEVETIEIDTNIKNVNLIENSIAPYQKPVPISEKAKFSLEIDEELYKSTNKYPDERYENLGVDYCRGYAILTINLYPTEYIPGEGRLFYHNKMRVNVDLEETGYISPLYRTDNQVDREWVKKLVVNSDFTNDYRTTSPHNQSYFGGLCGPSDNNGNGYDYVIIVREALFDFTDTAYNWSDLIQRKQADGLDATRVKVEDILSCSDYWSSDQLFNDTPALIREFCKDAFRDWDTKYILVAGDNDGPNMIERRLLHYGGTSMSQEYVDSDLYWSNLDNTFNDDHDNQWGEEGDDGFDLYSEIFIGSIPCDESIDISNWLAKSFFYADNYDPDYFDNAAFYAGDSGWPCKGDDFIDYSAIKGTDNWLGPNPDSNYPGWLGFQYGFETWNNENLGSQFDLSVKWTEEPPNSGWQGGPDSDAISGLRDAINNNQCTFISAIAHASPIYSLDVSDEEWESEYHNTVPFFIHDYGCHNGDMNAVDDGVLHSMLFHSDTSLAFGCVYNTGNGWGNYYCTNSSSAVQQKSFWDYFFDTNNNSGSIENWQLGKAQAWSKDLMAPTINWDEYGTWRSIIQGCLLFADPAQCIKPPIIYEHNVGVILLDVPGHVKSNETIYVNTTIANYGQSNESNVMVSLRVNDVEINSIVISFFESQTTEYISFNWTPTAGVHTVTINVTIPDIVENNPPVNEKSQNVIVGVYNSDTGECFDTIQEALDDPFTIDGHTILVPKGIYYENIMISKDISLIGIGMGSTIINGIGSGNTIVVNVQNTSSVTITGFTIRNCTIGVFADSSSDVAIYGNNISNNSETGIFIHSSNNIVIYNNDVICNQNGFIIDSGSSDNIIYHNKICNTQNAFDNGSNNQWDNSYYDGFRPCGGNYWSDFQGNDLYSGPDQDEPGSDGIVDIPYIVDGDSNSQDRYPLMKPWAGPLSSTIYVDDDNTMGPWDGTLEHPYRYIQDGVDVALVEGDTVVVFSGFYNEHVVIDRQQNISLIGENKETTVIDTPGWYDDGVIITGTAGWVNISGFTIENCYIGIHISSNSDFSLTNSVSNNIIYGNIIKCNSYGIYLYKSNNNTISVNSITNDNVEYGIYLYKSHYNTITDNTITENISSISSSGIKLIFSNNNIISGNTIVHSEFSGIHLIDSPDNFISQNYILDNKVVGIYLEYSLNITIIDNTFVSNGIYINGYLHHWNTHTIENNFIEEKTIYYYKNKNAITVPTDAASVILANCSNFVIQNLNISHDATNGIRLGFSSWNTITKNTVANQFLDGISIDYSSNNNTISENNITNSSTGILFNYGGCIINELSNNNTIIDNTITDNELEGVFIIDSTNNNISRNTLAKNGYGCFVLSLGAYSSENIISENNIIENNYCGIAMADANNNYIYHNNFIDNNNEGAQAFDDSSNTWDDGYLSGGNYWHEYTGFDNDGDGTGDTAYPIEGGDNEDRYPLMTAWGIESNLPDQPDRPSGHIIGKVGEEYNYTTFTTDPDSDEIYYMWDWGDDSPFKWIGPYESGEICNASHTWTETGHYSIGVMAKDRYGFRSDWSPYLPIMMPTLQPCFLAGTKITMADGSYKNIENIKVGDLVLSCDRYNDRITGAKVTKVYHHLREEMTDYYLILNNDLRVTPNHLLYINEMWKHADDASIGDRLLGSDGRFIQIESIDRIYNQVPTYNFDIGATGTFGVYTYIANGALVSTKMNLESLALLEIMMQEQTSYEELLGV